MTEEKVKPEKKFSAGAMSASVWVNEGKGKDGEKRKFRTVSLQRSYKDKNDEWQTTSSLRITDLPKASLIINKAYEYLVLKNFDLEEEMVV
ncbi:hypothetical protein HQ533_00010 [Candidatus Woesearchaeota archaeon]|nr:hypothetical protein [Candidatus Woesearchaeota archaeon]